MNDEIRKEDRPCLDRNTFLAEIQRLYFEGYPTREIAQLLHEDGNKVGRNLRELKRRWARAAQRQGAVLSQTQCAAIYREAMSGWGRSQLPKITTTEHRDADGKPVKTTIRRQEGPGDKTFLLAAVSALKTLRQFAPAGSPADKDPDAGDPMYLAILETLTPEQVDNLTHEQLQRIRLAVDRFRAEVDQFHAEVEAYHREKAGDCHDGPAGSPTANDAAVLPSKPAPQGAGEDSGPNGVEAASRRLDNAAGRRIDGLGEAVPPEDAPRAAAAPQEQTGESPLLAAHAEQQAVASRVGQACAASAGPPTNDLGGPADSPAAEETQEQAQTSDVSGPALASSLVPPYTDVPADSPAAQETQEQAETSDVGRPAHASSPDGAAPDERRSPVLVGGPRTVPTAAEHQAYQQWLARQYAIARHNLLLTQGYS